LISTGRLLPQDSSGIASMPFSKTPVRIFRWIFSLTSSIRSEDRPPFRSIIFDILEAESRSGRSRSPPRLSGETPPFQAGGGALLFKKPRSPRSFAEASSDRRIAISPKVSPFLIDPKPFGTACGSPELLGGVSLETWNKIGLADSLNARGQCFSDKSPQFLSPNFVLHLTSSRTACP